MATHRIVAFFQHEHEESLARRTLPGAEFVADSHAVGEADDVQIAALRNANIVFKILESPPQPPPRVAPRRMLGAPRPRPAAAVFPDRFIVISLPGPLLPQWREALASPAARIEERLGENAWLVRIDRQSEVDRVLGLRFVTSVERYQPADTGPAAPPDHWIEAFTSREDPVRIRAIYDVRLHQDESVDDVEAQVGVQILGKSRRKLRVLATIDESAAIAALPEVAEVTAWTPPELSSARARALTRADFVPPGATPLSGAGEIIAVADTGIDQAHDAFHKTKVHAIDKGRPGKTDDPHGHGTHVASIAAGGEHRSSMLRGVAPKAELIVQCLIDAKGELGGLPIDLNDLLDEAYKIGARIHNDSWGANVKGAYMANSREFDEFVWDHEDMLIVVAAGNEGTCVVLPPAIPVATKGHVEYRSIRSPASSKNALVVGASRSDRTSGGNAAVTYGMKWPLRFGGTIIGSEQHSGNPEGIAAFSSRGPTLSDQTKPDVVAPGTDIIAAASSLAPAWQFDGFEPGTSRTYGYMSGTSMAAPVVAGMAALVREWLRTTIGLPQPTAALLKALLVGGARRLTATDAEEGNPGKLPTWHQGHGCVDLARTIPIDGSFQLAFVDVRKTDPEAWRPGGPPRRRYRFEVVTPCSVTVTLAYTDYAGNALQNDLNLIVEEPSGAKHWGNTDLPPTFPRPDARNNVEVVRLQATPGTYIATIHPTVLAHFDQGYALTVTGQLLTSALTLF